jgi:hypothetical protein
LAQREERRQGEETRKGLGREEQAVREAARLPILIANCLVFERELLILADLIERRRVQLERYREDAKRWLGNENIFLSSLSDGPPDPGRYFVSEYDLVFLRFQVPTFKYQWEAENFQCTSAGGKYRNCDLTSHENLLVQLILRKNLESASRMVSILQEFLTEQKNRHSNHLKSLDLELRDYNLNLRL